MQVNTSNTPRESNEMLTEAEPVYGHPFMCTNLATDTFPQHSVPARVAHQMIKDELALDGNPSMNLASFVTTYMEREAEELMIEGLRKNYIDLDQYPQTAEIHNRCVQMLANLYHAPLAEGVKATGTGCIGSSEAIMLAGLGGRIAALLPSCRSTSPTWSSAPTSKSAGTKCASTSRSRSVKPTCLRIASC